jgi:hypothetical protein
VAVIIPKNAQHLDAIYSFCTSPDFSAFVRGCTFRENLSELNSKGSHEGG